MLTKKLEGHLDGDNVTKLAVEDDKKVEDSDIQFEEEVGRGRREWEEEVLKGGRVVEEE